MTFRIQIDGPGGRRITQTTAGTSAVLSDIPEGMYQWRITGLDSSGEALLESDIMTFHLADRPPAPLIVNPADGDTVNLRNTDSFVLRWRGIAGDFIYRISLSGPGGKLLFTAETRGTEYRFSRLNLLDRGTFTWTVRADRTFGPGNRVVGGERATGVFHITLGEMLKKPAILTPPTVYLR
jgi:hypothetical protein